MESKIINAHVTEVDLMALCSMVYDTEKYDYRHDKLIPNTNDVYGEQNYEFQGKEIIYRILSSTAIDPAFEIHGLQGSLVEIKGQKVIVFLATEMPNSKDGFKDWLQDLHLLSPSAYKREHSQFKDLEKWIDALKFSKEALQKIKFAGHSLGGGLASVAAIKYDAKGIVFGAVSAYNMLSPEERAKSEDVDVKNFYRINDIVAYLPTRVPRIGQQVIVKGKWESKNYRVNLFTPAGHKLDGFIHNGERLIRGITGALIEGIIGAISIGFAARSLGKVIAKEEEEMRARRLESEHLLSHKPKYNKEHGDKTTTYLEEVSVSEHETYEQVDESEHEQRH